MELPTTFGYELEANYPGGSHTPRTFEDQQFNRATPGFVVGTDHCGFEARSEVFKTWGQMIQGSTLIDAYKAHGVTTTRDCGLHIHVGYEGLGDETVRAKFFACLLLSQDLFVSQVPSHRQRNQYCRFANPTGFLAQSKAIIEDVIPNWLRSAGVVPKQFTSSYYNSAASAACGFTTPRSNGHSAILPLETLNREWSDYRGNIMAMLPPIPTQDGGTPNVHHGWVRLQPEHKTFEIRCFHSTLSKAELMASLGTVVWFVKKFKENPDAMLRALSERALVAINGAYNTFVTHRTYYERYMTMDRDHEREFFRTCSTLDDKNSFMRNGMPSCLARMTQLRIHQYNGQPLDLPDDFT